MNVFSKPSFELMKNTQLTSSSSDTGFVSSFCLAKSSLNENIYFLLAYCINEDQLY